ncbi:DUF11 domain-containing protein, partial [Methanobrevibacter sp. OttesenSCG-928-I08]|nr:DUF11 domain-containing protein [Methanobrevibacter sp. OttesenSCG-928-I08]
MVLISISSASAMENSDILNNTENSIGSDYINHSTQKLNNDLNINEYTISERDFIVLNDFTILSGTSHNVGSQSDLLALTLQDGDTINIINDFSFITNGRLNVNGLSNITILGNGYTINLQNHDYGFSLRNVNNVTIDGLKMINGYNPSMDNGTGGGAIFIWGTSNNITVNECVFENNTAAFHGGAVRIATEVSDVKFINNIFINNTAQFGGAISSEGNSSSVTTMKIEGNNKFISNVAYGASTSSGGAIHYVGPYLTIIGNNIFENNSALRGGAILVGGNSPSSLTIQGNNEFRNNSVSRNEFATSTQSIGGAIFVYSGKNILINGSNIFDGNSAYETDSNSQNGGAINIDSATSVIVSGSNQFLNNRAKVNGGGIYFGAKINELVICGENIFFNNEAGRGGAIFTAAFNALIDGNNFTKNKALAQGGGAIVISGNGINTIINNSFFEGNNVTRPWYDVDYAGGGAIYITNNNLNAIIENSTFKNNGDYHGGAIGIGSNTSAGYLINVLINKNYFINNTCYPRTANSGNNASSIMIANKNANVTVIHNYFETYKNKEQINNLGLLYLDNNTMKNPGVIEIYNANTITSYVNVTFLDNSTKIVNYGDNVTIPAYLTDDMGNIIVGGNISFYVNGSYVNTTFKYDDNGIFYINYTAIGHGLQIVSGNYSGVLLDYSNLFRFTGLLDIKMPVLNITKEVNVSKAKKDDLINYTITVENIGDGNATNVVLTDNFPNGLAFDDYVEKDLWSHDGGNVWTLKANKLTNGTTVKLTLIFKVIGNVIGNVSNNVTVHSDETNNNTTSNNTTLTNVSLVINKTADKDVVRVGDQLIYTIVVKNVGTTDASNVKVTDYVNSIVGLTYWKYENTGDWDYDGGSVWTLVDNLTHGESATLRLIFNVTGIGNVNNSVIVNSTDSDNETNSSNNTTLTNVSLVINKTADKDVVRVGDQLVYTIVVKNVGTTDASNVKVTDYVNSIVGLTYWKYENAGEWAYDGGSVWTLKNNLTQGDSATLRLIFNVTGIGNVNNSVVVNSTDSDNETNSSNNTTLTNVSLVISKVVDKSEANIGDLITYTVIIRNVGSTDATNVVVTEYFPNGLEFVDYGDKNLWNRNGNVFILNGVIAAGTNVTLTLVFRVAGNVTGNVNNTVNVKSNQTDDNNTTSNNTTLINVDVIKDVDNPTPNMGNVVTWTVTVINHGDEDTLIDMVIDYCPIGLVFVSASGDYEIQNYNSTHYKIIWKNINVSRKGLSVLTLK